MLAFSLFTALWLPQGPVVHFDKGHEALNIPFEINSDKIYLQVKVDGKGPFWFVLDSGSPSTVVDMQVARKLGLRLSNPQRTGGAGEGSTSMATTQFDTVSLPGLSYKPSRPLAIDVDAVMQAPEGRHVQGLVGGDFMARTIVEIDYAQRRVSFRDPATYRHSGSGFTVPIRVAGFMLADATLAMLDGKRLKGTFVVDTGARLAVTLNTPFVDENHLLTPSMSRVVVGSGLGGKVVHGLGRLAWLQLGDARLERPVATFSQDKSGVFAATQIQGLIGAEVLKRFRVTIDYPEKKLYLDPAGTPEPFEFDASGLFLIAKGSDLRKYEILSVAPRTPAAEAGIRDGDQIDYVDGRPAADLSLEQIRQRLRRIGATVSLVVSRDGKQRTVSLRLRRVV